MFITPSTFSDFAFFAPPPRLFQPPRFLERWEYKFSLKMVLGEKIVVLSANSPYCEFAQFYQKVTKSENGLSLTQDSSLTQLSQWIS